jgi:hypothetical protein
VNLDVPGLTQESLNKFVRHFAIDIAHLKRQIAAAQSYDQDYGYTLSPLKIFPLVWVDLKNQRSLIAPVPTFLVRRFTEGVYYEVCNAPNFSKAFGNAFQRYVGEVLHATNEDPKSKILPEHEYHVGKERKDIVDWIVTDDTADLFIECKTKKIRYASKIALAKTEVLDEDLDKMATFIVQAYKTLKDAQQGLYEHWSPKGRPIYPIIVTLEDWYVSLPNIVTAIDERVRKKLAELNIDDLVLQQNPYTICSVADLERAMQVIAQVGARPFMNRRFEGDTRFWPIRSFMLSAFKDEMRHVRTNLFPDEMDRIGPPNEEVLASHNCQ